MALSPMMRFLRLLACGSAVLVFAAACGAMRGPPPGAGGPNGAIRPLSEQEQNIRLILSFDGNSDGTVTRDEMEAALRRQFAACDTNGDGRIDIREMQAENDRRFRVNMAGASPLIDWNQNGQIDFDEFATTARSLFAELDRDSDGKLAPDELRLLPPGRARPPPMEAPPGGRAR
jgi:Ca2+-binding EF-hand superfamily protein